MNIDDASHREGCARAAVNAFERSCRIYYRHLSLYGTPCTYGESHREGCVRVPRSAPRVTSDTGCTAQLQRCVPAGPCLQWEWNRGGWGARVAPQELEVGEVSQRGGQGGDALVGEVVGVQAARARGRGGGSKGRSRSTRGGPQ